MRGTRLRSLKVQSPPTMLANTGTRYRLCLTRYSTATRLSMTLMPTPCTRCIRTGICSRAEWQCKTLWATLPHSRADTVIPTRLRQGNRLTSPICRGLTTVFPACAILRTTHGLTREIECVLTCLYCKGLKIRIMPVTAIRLATIGTNLPTITTGSAI